MRFLPTKPVYPIRAVRGGMEAKLFLREKFFFMVGSSIFYKLCESSLLGRDGTDATSRTG